MLEIYLTGIKPNSGITFITGGIAATMQSLDYSTGVYLPAQTGAELKDGFIQAPDMLFLKYMDKNIMTYCSYIYKNKRLSNEVFEEEKLLMDRNIIFQDYMNVIGRHECLIINGQSDLSTPIEPYYSEEELIRELNTPIIFTASLKNSTVEDIISYLNYTRIKGLQVRGVLINEYPIKNDSDIRGIQGIIERNTGIPVLGILPHIPNLRLLKPEDLIGYILGCTDIESIFKLKIAKLSS